MNSLAICEDDGYMLEKLEEMAECYVKSKGLHTVVIAYASFMIGAHDNETSANYAMFDFN